MSKDHQVNKAMEIRRAGVLLHPTSLPGPLDNGDFGHEAYRFIEFLSSSGFSVWQMLPLGPTHADQSPYQCLSAHAGNPFLISLSWLVDRGWLDASRLSEVNAQVLTRANALDLACKSFYENLDKDWSHRLKSFQQENSFWLDDFALFMAIKEKQGGDPWYMWPAALRDRSPSALKQARLELNDAIAQITFEQFVFFLQWHELREYASTHGVLLFGDMPIFVAHDSVDVWSNPGCFLSDSSGELSFVAGVPPDAFSDTGQRWGNPLYDWEYMQQDDYRWWKERFKTQLKLFDLIRIDHFRGLESYWQIAASEETAMNGKWVKAPGENFLATMLKTFNELPIVAEDLGLITEEVIELRKLFNLPGMKILQFAFGDTPSNPYLPHNHDHYSVVYAGTHDNDTTLGWWNSLDKGTKENFLSYAGSAAADPADMLFTMIRMALGSVCPLAVLTMQDILSLGTAHRMNTPGTVEGNWQWRFTWDQVSPDLSSTYKKLLSTYDRIH